MLMFFVPFVVAQAEEKTFSYRFEAEEHAVGLAQVRSNPLASNEAYVGGIDRFNDGIVINARIEHGGPYLLTVAYTAEFTGDHPSHELKINTVSKGVVDYEESTGWGATGFYEPAFVSKEVTLVPGLNSIALLKTSIANKWAEIDYVTLDSMPGETYVEDEPEEIVPGIYGVEDRLSNGASYAYFDDHEGVFAAFTGTGDRMSLIYDATETGNYEMRIDYYNPSSSSSSLEVLVEGVSKGRVLFFDTKTASTTSIVIGLTEGEQVIDLRKTLAADKDTFIRFIMFEPTSDPENGSSEIPIPTFGFAGEESLKIEVEDAQLTGSQTKIHLNPLAGNGAYVGSIDTSGCGIEFDLIVPETRIYTMLVHYTMGPESEVASHNVLVDGRFVGMFMYDVMTGWGEAGWYEPAMTGTALNLEEGRRNIKIQKTALNGGYAELDYIVIHDHFIGEVPPVEGTRYEAEDQTFLSGFETIVTDYLSSGYGHVTVFGVEGDGLTFAVDVDRAGSYDLSFYYVNGHDDQGSYDLLLNENRIGGMIFDGEGMVEGYPTYRYEVVTVRLPKGESTITLRFVESDSLSLDFMDLAVSDQKPINPTFFAANLTVIVILTIVIIGGAATFFVLRHSRKAGKM